MALLFVTFISFTLGKQLLKENDVEFDYTLGHIMEFVRFHE